MFFLRLKTMVFYGVFAGFLFRCGKKCGRKNTPPPFRRFKKVTDSPRLVDSFFDGRRDRLAQQVSALKPPGVFRHAGGKAVEDGFFGFNKKGDLQNIEKNMEDLF